MGEQAAAVGDDVARRRAAAFLGDDESLRHLAPLRVGDGDDRDLEDVGVLGDRLLHLDGRDVFAAGDDDVLLAVAELDVAVGVHDGDVARMEPAAAEGLRRRLGIVEVARHDVVVAHHHLAHRLAVRRHVPQLLVDDANRIGGDHVQPLA